MELDPLAQLTCVEDGLCPESWHCAETIGRCVRDDNPDHAGPELQRATAESSTELVLDFSEPLFPEGIGELERYSIRATDEAAAAPTVTAAFLLGPQTLVLATTLQFPGREYRVTVEGFFDLVGNEPLAAEVPFTGFGEPPDVTPPDPLRPQQDAQLKGPIAFAWSGRRGATSYTLEIARDEGMAEIVRSETTSLETSLEDVSLSAGTFFWRVRSDLSGGSAPRVLHVFADAVHVFCPHDTECSEEGAGTQEQPFQRIGAAIQLAERLGIRDVAVASRGEGAAYDEKVVLADGHHLKGGYDPAFTVSEPTTFPTTIRTSTSPALTVPYVPEAVDAQDRPDARDVHDEPYDTVVSGLRIVVEGSSELNYALVLLNSSSRLLVENCEIEVTVSTSSQREECIAAIVRDSGGSEGRGPSLVGNRFSSRCSGTASVAVALYDSSPVLEGNQLSSSAWYVLGHAVGLQSEGTGWPVLTGNGLQVEGTEATGVSISNPQSHLRQARLESNRMRVEASQLAVGLDLQAATNVEALANHVSARANTAVAARVVDPDKVTLANNVLIAGTAEWENESNTGIEVSGDYYFSRESGARFVHNSVLLGRVADYGRATGMRLSEGAQPSLVNNLLLALPSAGPKYGIWEEGDSDPASVRNNALLGFEVLYRDDVEGEITSGSELWRLDGQALGTCSGGTCPIVPMCRVQDNVVLSATPDELFADFAG